MATLTVYNGYAGCTSLVEYRGSAGDIVAMTAAIRFVIPLRFADIALSVLALYPLQPLANQLLGGLWVSGQMLSQRLVEANSNGIAHVVLLQTAAVAPGDVLHVSALVL